MTMSLVGGQPKNLQIPVNKQQNIIKHAFLMSDYR